MESFGSNEKKKTKQQQFLFCGEMGENDTKKSSFSMLGIQAHEKSEK